jgi:hypothetical protein
MNGRDKRHAGAGHTKTQLRRGQLSGGHPARQAPHPEPRQRPTTNAEQDFLLGENDAPSRGKSA